MKKILITGGGGQLGRELYAFLFNKYDIIMTSRQSISSNNVIKYLTMDISDRDNVNEIITTYNPDIIINCAAFRDVDANENQKKYSREVNVSGLRNILLTSSKNTHIIQISSDYVFDGENGPYFEDDSTHPVNYYGKIKLEAENILRGSLHRWTIIRPNVIYGSNVMCKSNFFAWVYRSLLSNKHIDIVSDQISNPTLITDLVESIFQCIMLEYEGILHYGSENYLSRYDFGIQIAEKFKFNDKLIPPISTEKLHKKLPLPTPHQSIKIETINK